MPRDMPGPAKGALRTFWCVRYLLRGKVLADVQVEAATEDQALIVARSQVRANLRRLADEIKVERMP